MDLGFLAIDFDQIFSVIGVVLMKAVKIPFRMIHGLPSGVKLGLTIFLVIITLIIALLVWKNRDEWRTVERL